MQQTVPDLAGDGFRPEADLVINVLYGPERLFLAGFARGVLAVARGLLISLERCFGFRPGDPFGMLTQIFFDDSPRLPRLVGVAQRLSLMSSSAFGRLSFRRSKFSRCCGFHPRSVRLGGLCVPGRRGRAHLFELGFLRVGCSLDPLDEIRFFSRHVLNPSI